MASIGSLPFNIETKKETSAPFQSRNYRRRFSYFWAKSLEAKVVHDSLAGNSKAAKLFCDRLIAGWSRGQPVPSKPLLRAMSTTSTSGEMSNESEDSHDATIQRSKKILEVQRELLQQIAERRKLVTSIKNSVTETWEDEDSNEQDNGDSPIISTKNVAGLCNGGIMSSSTGHLAVEEEAESSTKHGENEKEQEMSMDVKKQLSSLDLFNELESSDLGTELSDSTAVNDDRASNSPEIIDIKPPPLSGVNVMNVVIVAAECAPWSKTGGLQMLSDHFQKR